MVQKYVDDALALRRSWHRHRRLGWHDSAAALLVEARSRMGYARMWSERRVTK